MQTETTWTGRLPGIDWHSSHRLLQHLNSFSNLAPNCLMQTAKQTRQPTISTDRKTKRSFPFDDMSLVLSSHIFLPWLMTLMNFGPNHVSLEFYRWANCLVSCECLVASVLFSQMVWDYSTSRPRPTDMHRSARRAFKSTSTTIHNNKWGPFLTPSLDTSSIVFYSPAFHHLLLCLMASAAFP